MRTQNGFSWKQLLTVSAAMLCTLSVTPLKANAGYVDAWFQLQDNGTLAGISISDIDPNDWPDPPEYADTDTLSRDENGYYYHQGATHRYYLRGDDEVGTCTFGCYALPSTFANYTLTGVTTSTLTINEVGTPDIVLLPDTITKMTLRSFGERATLIPKSVTEIDNTFSLHSEILTITPEENHMFYVYEGSYAESWAKLQGFAYTVVSDETLEDTIVQKAYSVYLDQEFADDSEETKATCYAKVGKLLLDSKHISTSRYAVLSANEENDNSTTAGTNVVNTTTSSTTTTAAKGVAAADAGAALALSGVMVAGIAQFLFRKKQ